MSYCRYHQKLDQLLPCTFELLKAKLSFLSHLNYQDYNFDVEMLYASNKKEA